MLKSQNDPIYVESSDEWSPLARAFKCSVFRVFGELVLFFVFFVTDMNFITISENTSSDLSGHGSE